MVKAFKFLNFQSSYTYLLLIMGTLSFFPLGAEGGSDTEGPRRSARCKRPSAKMVEVRQGGPTSKRQAVGGEVESDTDTGSDTDRDANRKPSSSESKKKARAEARKAVEEIIKNGNYGPGSTFSKEDAKKAVAIYASLYPSAFISKANAALKAFIKPKGIRIECERRKKEGKLDPAERERVESLMKMRDDSGVVMTAEATAAAVEIYASHYDPQTMYREHRSRPEDAVRALARTHGITIDTSQVEKRPVSTEQLITQEERLAKLKDIVEKYTQPHGTMYGEYTLSDVDTLDAINLYLPEYPPEKRYRGHRDRMMDAVTSYFKQYGIKIKRKQIKRKIHSEGFNSKRIRIGSQKGGEVESDTDTDTDTGIDTDRDANRKPSSSESKKKAHAEARKAVEEIIKNGNYGPGSTFSEEDEKKALAIYASLYPSAAFISNARIALKGFIKPRGIRIESRNRKGGAGEKERLAKLKVIVEKYTQPHGTMYGKDTLSDVDTLDAINLYLPEYPAEDRYREHRDRARDAVRSFFKYYHIHVHTPIV